MKLTWTIEFRQWFKQKSAYEQVQIQERLRKIEEYAHFGECKYLGNKLSELKWKNGTRVYFARIAQSEILLLIGGDKHGQNKDIAQAHKVLKKYQTN